MLKVFLDFETTGLSVYHDEISQMAARAELPEPEEFVTYVRSTRPISEGSAAVTKVAKVLEVGIQKFGETEEEAKRRVAEEVKKGTSVPKNPTSKEALEMLLSWLCTLPGPKCLLAYNGFSFDFPILYSELHRWHMDPLRKLRQAQVEFLVDPLKWARIDLDRSLLLRKPTGEVKFRQCDVYKAIFGEDLEDAHDALADITGLSRICGCEEFNAMPVSSESLSCLKLETFVKTFGLKRANADSSVRRQVKRKVASVPTVFDFYRKKRLRCQAPASAHSAPQENSPVPHERRSTKRAHAGDRNVDERAKRQQR